MLESVVRFQHAQHTSGPCHPRRSCVPGQPVELLQLPFGGKELHFVLVNPLFEAPTAQMRAVLPKEVPMKSMINNCCQGGSLVRWRLCVSLASTRFESSCGLIGLIVVIMHGTVAPCWRLLSRDFCRRLIYQGAKGAEQALRYRSDASWGGASTPRETLARLPLPSTPSWSRPSSFSSSSAYTHATGQPVGHYLC